MRVVLAFHDLEIVGESDDQKNVLEQIKFRFFADYIYNNVGPILIALNPYKPLNVVGDLGHTCEASMRSVPINDMANLIVRGLKQRNQSIVISGGNK
jgi:myosin heavy subunit